MQCGNKIYTDNKKILVAEVDHVDQKPVAKIKHGKSFDIITLDSFASQLYGMEVQCIIKVKKKNDKSD